MISSLAAESHEGPRGVFAGPAQPQPAREQAGPGVGSFVPYTQTMPLVEGGVGGVHEI
jgi:hypothetical protein